MKMLKNSYVRQGGKIWPFGMVSVFANHVKFDDTENDSLGLFFWSEELLPYGNENYFAKICDGELKVFCKETGEARIISNLKVIHSNSMVIVEDFGYLRKIGAFGNEIKDLDDEFHEDVKRALRAVAEGKDAPFNDVRPFHKVSEEFLGSRLISFNLDYTKPDSLKAFTLKGKEVACTTEYPLKRKS